MKFADLRLAEPLLRAVSSENYETATPIQAKAIPPILEGKDVLGCAQTGTGKTAAFALPILNHLHNNPRKAAAPRVLILCPTRELAVQIEQSFQTYGQHVAHRRTTIFGGVSQHGQVQNLRRGVDVIVATPGRLMDLMQQRHVNLSAVEILVLDEADRMLDMGFIHDVRRISAALPPKRQTLLFSATMPNEIKDLAHSLLKDPVKVTVTPPATTLEIIDQSVYMVDKGNKSPLLAHLFHNLPMSRSIVFCRTKHGSDRVVRHMHALGIKAEAIHGNKSQNARQRALDNFRSMKTPMLIATDIAARGIDIDGITHVINYDLTHEPDTYVHRIGRTARAGAGGTAISFCDREERSNLRAIESLIRMKLSVRDDQPVFAAKDAQALRQSEPTEQSRGQGGQRQSDNRPPRRDNGRDAGRGGQRDHAKPRDGNREPQHQGAQHRPHSSAAGQSSASGKAAPRAPHFKSGRPAGPSGGRHPVAGRGRSRGR